MKKLISIITAAIMIGGLNSEVRADGSNGANGFILGAGGGAILGQAIGRNTEATLLGTAIGSMLGYVIGNEHDKYGDDHQRYGNYRPVKKVYTPPPRTYYSETRVPPVRHQDEQICQESEVLATINGQPEKIFTTVCLEDGKWVIASEDIRIDQTIIIDENNPRGAYKPAYWKHRKPWRNSRWNRPVSHRDRHFNRNQRDRYFRSHW